MLLGVDQPHFQFGKRFGYSNPCYTVLFDTGWESDLGAVGKRQNTVRRTIVESRDSPEEPFIKIKIFSPRRPDFLVAADLNVVCLRTPAGKYVNPSLAVAPLGAQGVAIRVQELPEPIFHIRVAYWRLHLDPLVA